MPISSDTPGIMHKNDGYLLTACISISTSQEKTRTVDGLAIRGFAVRWLV